MDDRIIIQANQTKLSFKLFLGQQRECYQDAGVLCADSTVTNGCHQKKGSYQKIICQYDNSYTIAFDELCRTF